MPDEDFTTEQLAEAEELLTVGLDPRTARILLESFVEGFAQIGPDAAGAFFRAFHPAVIQRRETLPNPPEELLTVALLVGVAFDQVRDAAAKS